MANDLLAVGIPTLAVLIGILINNSHLSDLRGHVDKRLDDVQVLMRSEIHRLDQVSESRTDVLLGKIEDIDNRLTRLEERFAR
ncbi:MAG: hypothetical protein ABSC23_06200 [Bryobacteraceae bacterium]|jgi:hypothetical protein